MLYLRKRTIFQTEKSEVTKINLTFSKCNIAAWTNYNSSLFLNHIAPFIDFERFSRELLEEIARVYECSDSKTFWLQLHQLYILSHHSSNMFQRRSVNISVANRWRNRQRNKRAFNAARCSLPTFKKRMKRKCGTYVSEKDLFLRKFQSRSTAVKQKSITAQIPIGTISYLSRKKRRTPEKLVRYRRPPLGRRSWLYLPYKVIDKLYDPQRRLRKNGFHLGSGVWCGHDLNCRVSVSKKFSSKRFLWQRVDLCSVCRQSAVEFFCCENDSCKYRECVACHEKMKDFRPVYIAADSSKNNKSSVPTFSLSHEQCEDLRNLPERAWARSFSWTGSCACHKQEGKYLSNKVNKKWLNRHRNRRDVVFCKHSRQERYRVKKQRRSKQRRRDLKFAGAL